LNDAINAFSISCLLLLHQAHSNVHLRNPSNRCLKMIPEHLDPKQIASLCTCHHGRIRGRYLLAFSVFNRLVSVILLCQQKAMMIRVLVRYFQDVRNFSLWFDDNPKMHLVRSESPQSDLLRM
jgi:hypothetical protein